MEQPPSYDDIVRYPTMPTISGSGINSGGSSMTQQYKQQHLYQQQQQHHHHQQQQQQQQQQRQQQYPPSHAQPQLNAGGGPRRPKLGAVPLYEDSTDRRRVSELADLFAIIKATESLEAAYSRDVVTSQHYAASCSRLIAHFKATESALQIAGIISGGSAESFFREFNVDCPRAYDRLIVAGVPATVIHGGGGSNDSGGGGGGGDSVLVAEIVQAFITAIDALALEDYAIDTVQPLLSDLMGALTRLTSSANSTDWNNVALPPDFEALVKLRLWLQKLNEMRAYEELQQEEARQLKFDLESSYQAFMKHLSNSTRR